MTEISQLLQRRYATSEQKPACSKSWIQKKANGGDPQELLRRQINKDLPDPDKTINNEVFLAQVKEDIFEQVTEYLLNKHGAEALERKVGHFNDSWTKFYERYGNLIILSLGELTDEIEFLNAEGYIDRYKLGKQMESVAKRLGISGL